MVFISLSKLNENNKIDFSYLISLSRRFIRLVNIDNKEEDLTQLKRDVQNSKTILFQIIAVYVSILSRRDYMNEDFLSFGLRLKFEEDVGAVLGNLKQKQYNVNIEKLISMS